MMLKLSGAAIALALLLAAGCASHDQSMLQQQCAAGDQNACYERAQNAQDPNSSRYPGNPTLNVPGNVVGGQGAMPAGGAFPSGSIGGGGIGGVGGR